MTIDVANEVPKTGLEELRSMIGGLNRTGIGKTLGFVLVRAEVGYVLLEGTPGPHLHNPLGLVHGGYAATMLDSACGLATHSQLGIDQGYATLEIKVAYHKAIREKTGVVRAEGRILTLGKRTAFTEATLKDTNETLLATATSTLLVTERKKM